MVTLLHLLICLTHTLIRRLGAGRGSDIDCWSRYPALPSLSQLSGICRVVELEANQEENWQVLGERAGNAVIKDLGLFYPGPGQLMSLLLSVTLE